jgi:hypothetical protein
MKMMISRIRGRNKRVRTPTLPIFLGSAAPDVFKTAITELLGRLQAYVSLDATVLQERDPELLESVNRTVPGIGLDFLRVLRGEPPVRGALRRQNVAASLRDKAGKSRGQLDAATYEPGHYVSVMAWVYWGSIAAWAEKHATCRCRPSKYWQNREHQLQALRDWAKTHPDQSLSHAALQKARLHALASILSSADLSALAKELGLDRKLKIRAQGYWSKPVLIDTYAELCRSWGATLSSDALARIGGTGFVLRSKARIFGGFRAFQDAVVARHSDVKPPDRPTARDGRQLDSWQEVVAYNAFCAALPEVTIESHVLLADGRRSCDLVVNGKTYVEILRFSLADIAEPATPAACKYSRQWAAKMRIYEAMGVTPIAIEPDDIHQPDRLSACVVEIAEHVNTPVAPLPPSSGKSLRPKGFWSHAALCAAVAEVAAARGGFPTYAELQSAGYGHAAVLLRKRGMRDRVAAEIGRPLRHVKRTWSEDRIITELATWVETHGAYPTSRELAAGGQSRLLSAQRRLFRGKQDRLRSLVAKRSGRTLPRRIARSGSYASLDQLANSLRPLCDALGRFPSCREMNAALPETVFSEVSRRVGLQAMAERMGVPYRGPRRRTRQEALQLFRQIAPEQDGLPGLGVRSHLTTTQIRRALGSKGIVLMQRMFGGIAELRKALESRSPEPASDAAAGATGTD